MASGLQLILRKIRVSPDVASGLQLILRLKLILVLQFPRSLTLEKTTVNLDTTVVFHFTRILIISRGRYSLVYHGETGTRQRSTRTNRLSEVLD